MSYLYRSAITGEIVTEAYALRNPHITVREVVPPRKPSASVRAAQIAAIRQYMRQR